MFHPSQAPLKHACMKPSMRPSLASPTIALQPTPFRGYNARACVASPPLALADANSATTSSGTGTTDSDGQGTSSSHHSHGHMHPQKSTAWDSAAGQPAREGGGARQWHPRERQQHQSEEGHQRGAGQGAVQYQPTPLQRDQTLAAVQCETSLQGLNKLVYKQRWAMDAEGLVLAAER